MSLYEERKEGDTFSRSLCEDTEDVGTSSKMSLFKDTKDVDTSSKSDINEERSEGGAVMSQKTSSSEPSCVSIKSAESKIQPPNLSDGEVYFDPSVKSCSICTAFYCQSHIKQHGTGLHTHTWPNETGNLQQNFHQAVHDVLQKVKDRHKSSMKNKYKSLFEGIKLQENPTLLNRIYTQLYITEGESEGVNKEHEVLQMEKTSRKKDTPINCNDIFKLLHEAECEEQRTSKKDPIKTVLTKGIAGIGKTVSVQKFILDWAEGKANQDVDFMFVLPFRELNLIRDDQYSLHQLLLDFYPELQDVDSKIYEVCKVLFILDGLDESRNALEFSDSESISDMTKTSSLGVLMTNLITGELLPSSLIWITSRPAAASQISSKYINRLTEIQGFNHLQKEEYFRKKISDQHQATRIILHIKTVRSLHIMCHIPVFCWISATVLQNNQVEIPKSLTEMYIHFLLTQINMRNQKYDERCPTKLLHSNRDVIVKLGELAFKQLMKGNVMFYEEDLIESGINVTDASVYSGMCTEIFKEESVIHQRKVYCFVHLSFQEFLAAFYVFYSYLVMNTELLQSFLYGEHNLCKFKIISLFELLKIAVDKTLQIENGRLDLFIRFLLGISLESNQRLLQGLLTHTENSLDTIRETTQYIKKKIKGDGCFSADRSINLFLCLLEVNDQTLFRDIQDFLKTVKYSQKKLSPAHCSTIAYVLQISEVELDALDFMQYNTSDEGRRRLMPAVMKCRKAFVALALQSSNSLLRELDLSFSELRDSGVQLISVGLESPNCQLEILRLSRCMVTKEGCSYLVSALSSNPSQMRELDLSYNYLGDSEVKIFSTILNDPNCKLEILSVDKEGKFIITEALQKYACDLTLDPNTVNTCLVLSEEKKIIKPNVKENWSHTGDPDRSRYPDHPERFEMCPQVLCRESLSGRCYWEAEWSGNKVDISMTYKGIRRKGWHRDAMLGLNEYSWSLNYSNDKFTFCHNTESKEVFVPLNPPKRVGVYLDWLNGTLSFYSVSNKHTLTHLYTFSTTFTEPLYAGFGVYSGALFLCQPGQSSIEQKSSPKRVKTGQQLTLSLNFKRFSRVDPSTLSKS